MKTEEIQTNFERAVIEATALKMVHDGHMFLEAMREGNLLVLLVKNSSGGMDCYNYHPMRKGLVHTHSMRKYDPEYGLESIKSLMRLYGHVKKERKFSNWEWVFQGEIPMEK